MPCTTGCTPMPRGKRLKAAQRGQQRQQEDRRRRNGWVIENGRVVFTREPGWIGQLEAIKAALETTK